MLRSRLFVALLIASALLVPAAAVQAQKKTLDTLNSKDVQDRVAEYLKERPQPELAALAVLDPRTITYTKSPPQITWALQPARAKLTPAEEMQIKTQATGLLKDALGQYKGGLLSEGFDKLNFEVTLQPADLPAQVDEDAIRKRAAEYLAEKKPSVRLLSQFVVLDPEGIVYRRTRKPGALTWTVTARSDISGYESLLKENVHDVLTNILGTYKGGLFNAQQMDKVRPLIDVQLKIPPKSSDPAGSQAGSLAAAAPGCVVGVVPPNAAPKGTGGSRGPGSSPEPLMPPAEDPEPSPMKKEMPSADKNGEAAEAAQLYRRGQDSYWEGKYQQALMQLQAAIQLNPEDARFWYYKGLAEMKLNRRQEALKSFEKALDLHSRGKPGSDAIKESLQRVQGPMRDWFHMALQATQQARPEPVAQQ